MIANTDEKADHDTTAVFQAKNSKVLRLACVQIINRILYVNNQPALNHLLPLSNGWKVNEMANEIMRACAAYDVVADSASAQYLALHIVRQILREQYRGRFFEIGWD